MKKVSDKTVYCYAVVAEDDISGKTYPLCVALSNSHATEDIVTLLLNVRRGFRLVTGKKMEPPVIVTDYSWALIHGSLWAFRLPDLHSYLHFAWEYIHRDKDELSDKFGTMLVLCRAHVMHSLASVLKQEVKNKKIRASYLYLLAKVMDSTTIEAVSDIFSNICQLALSHTPVQFPDTPRGAEDDTDDEDESQASVPPPNRSLRTTTPFGKHFTKLESDVRSKIDTSEEVTNAFYAPEVIKHLQASYVPLLPLWTRLVSGQSLSSNAAVEAYFKVLKTNQLRGRRGLLAGDFARIAIEDFSAKIKEDIMSECERRTQKIKSKQDSKDKRRPRNGAQNSSQKRKHDEESEGSDKKKGEFHDTEFEEEKCARKGVDKKARKKTYSQAAAPSPLKAMQRTEDTREATERSRTIGNIVVSSWSLRTLEGTSLLDDVIIDASVLLATEKDGDHSVVLFSVHVLPQMEKIAASRKHTELLQDDYPALKTGNLWLVPAHTESFKTHPDHENGHWLLFVVFFKSKRIVLLDSASPSRPDRCQLECVMVLISLAHGRNTWADWKVVVPDKQVRQTDATSCGLFVITAAQSVCGTALEIPSDKCEQVAFFSEFRKQHQRELQNVSSVLLRTTD